jgi:hypothetical protein
MPSEIEQAIRTFVGETSPDGPGDGGIDEIAVNPNGVPRGAIPRSEFERLLAF